MARGVARGGGPWGAAAIASRQTDLFLERQLDRVRAFPGARELLARMREEELKVFVASSSGPEKLGPLLARAGVRDLVEGSVPPDDVDRSKPAQDLVAAALEETGVAAQEAVMIGDTPYDVEACRRAGVRIVAVRCGGWRDDALEGAAAVYDDPADVLAHFEETPFAG